MQHIYNRINNLSVKLLVGACLCSNALCGQTATTNTTNAYISAASVLSFDANEIGTAVSLEQFLHGRVAGLLVRPHSGNNSEGGTLTLRGHHSLNATNEPLIILDGMIFERPQLPSVVGGYVENFLKNINVKDVERVTVLKDGTAQYGAKAANGVILIETKKARNATTQITLSAYAGVNTAPRKLPTLNADDYRSYANSILNAKGFTPEQIKNQYAWLNVTPQMWDYPMYANNTDWQKEIYDNALMQDYHLGILGGDEIAKYALSVGYLSNGSSLKGTNYQRYTTHLNGDLQITKRLKLYSSIGYTFSENLSKPTGLLPGFNPIQVALEKPQVFAPYQIIRGFDGQPVTTPILADIDPLGLSNPAALTDKVDATNNTNQFFGVIDFQYQFNRHWMASAKAGLNYAKAVEELFVPSMGVASLVNGEYDRMASRNAYSFTNFNAEATIKYQQSFERHHVNTAVGVRYHSSTMNASINTDFSMPNDEFKGLGSGSSSAATTALDKKRITSAYAEWRTFSDYLTASYNYDSRYFLTLNASIDMSSQFATNKVGIFPSVNAAWNVSREAFMSSVSFVTDWRFRAGYTLTGNDDLGYNVARSYYQAQAYRNVSGLVQGNLANPNMKWEAASTFNVGTDLSLMKNRLSLMFDFFTTQNNNLLLYHQYPYHYGHDGYWNNSAATQSSGWELTMNATVIDVDKFRWNVTGNISSAKATVTSLPSQSIVTDIPGGQVITQLGASPYQFYGLKSEGVYASQSDIPLGLKWADGTPIKAGDMRYADLTQDGTIDSHDYQSLGSADPQFFGGFGTSVHYQGISLSLFFDYQMGNSVFNYVRMQRESMTGSLISPSSAIANRWQSEGQTTSMPRLSVTTPQNAAFSSRWIEDGSFLRLRNLIVSYDIPLKKGFLHGLKLFAQADNLFTISSYLGQHPQVSYGGQAIFNGCDYFKMAQSPTFALGVKIGL